MEFAILGPLGVRVDDRPVVLGGPKPLGSGLVNEYDVAGNVIRVYAPIQMAPLSDGRGGITRYGHHRIGGTDCREDGPFGSYRWSVSRGELTLTGIHERCGNRRAIWEGAWTRAR